MCQIVYTVFGVTQTGIGPASYLPNRNLVTNAVRNTSADYWQKFIDDLKDGLVRCVEAIIHTRAHFGLAVSAFGL